MKDYFKKIREDKNPYWLDKGYGTRFQEFQNLMRFRIREVLIVSSLYDLFIFEEDGRLFESIRSEYRELNLSHIPDLTRVSSGEEALSLLREENRFDLVITTLHMEDMRPSTFAKKIKKEGIEIPIVMLAFDNRELADMLLHEEDRLFDQIFIWLGNFRLILAIIKHIEDRLNVEHDTHVLGVQSLILVEDNIRYYSSFLPILYLEIMKQSQRCIKEGVNLSDKYIRQRARPKILLCKNFEEAWHCYEKYEDTLLGLISDVEFMHQGKLDSKAGFLLAEKAHSRQPDLPILLQSTHTAGKKLADNSGYRFLMKNSQTLHDELRQFLINSCGFGDFVFRTSKGQIIGRASDLDSLEKQIELIPENSFKYHAERNHFSSWLKARTEVWLAHKLRPQKISDFPSVDDTRKDLLNTMKQYRKMSQRGVITDFDKETFDPDNSISRIGEGSLGGKARGLGFVNKLINNYNAQDYFEKVWVSIPPAVIIASDIFDQFIDENDLKHFAMSEMNDQKILRKFLRARKFPSHVITQLESFLELVRKPIAVRSSSLLEDSHNYPFAGVYETYMLPNSDPNLAIRLNELLKTIKHVYASTYFQVSKEYFKATSFRLEDEKMAVIIQVLSGSFHNRRYYPTFSGIAQSYNFYPVSPQKSSDGIVSVALGLGKMIVDGGVTLRFCPKYPHHIMQLSSPKLALESNQHDFYAVNLDGEMNREIEMEDPFVQKYSLKTAEEDGTLQYVASTYSPDDDSIYDDLSRKGIPLVSFAPILKYDLLPLPKIIEFLLDLGSWAMGTPVEIEFAVDMSKPKDEPIQFNLLQIRPMVLDHELEMIKIKDVDRKNIICQSNQILGNGMIDVIHDIVLVDRDNFDRSRSNEVAEEISKFNSLLLNENRPYLLIGVGRWGTLDPWLGIPVKWSQISGARVIIETEFKDFDVAPSQGSHFFENLNCFSIGYLTIQNEDHKNYIDWDWLLKQRPIQQMKYVNLLRYKNSILVKMDGHKSQGVVFKPN